MGLLDLIKDALTFVVENTLGRMTWLVQDAAVEYLIDQLALNTINSDMMKDPVIKAKFEKLQESWHHTPSSISDIVNDFVGICAYEHGREQLQQILNVDIDSSMPVTNSVFNQIDALTDIEKVLQSAGIIGSMVPMCNLQQLAGGIDRIIQASGMSQISGFGYGQIFSAVIAPQMQQEINTKIAPIKLDNGTLRLLFMRKLIDKDTYLRGMRRNGYDGGVAWDYYNAGLFYPGGNDFVKYAVRDVFNPAAVSSGKLMDMFPDEIVEHAAKAGMSREILEWEWASHWQLPSPNMAFEMLHRGEISLPNLRMLLKQADYAPGYIENMINIAYKPYSRVDARRMHTAGVLDDNEFLKSMQEIGYTVEKAQKLLEWTKSTKGQSQKDLTQSQILRSYNLGIKDQKNTVTDLEALGYDNVEATTIVSLSDRDNELDVIGDQLKAAEELFSVGNIDLAGLKAVINGLAIPAHMQKAAIARADLLKAKLIKIPSRATLQKWYKKQLIDGPEFIRRMQILGYQESDIQLYLLDL